MEVCVATNIVRVVVETLLDAAAARSCFRTEKPDALVRLHILARTLSPRGERSGKLGCVGAVDLHESGSLRRRVEDAKELYD